MKTRKYAAPAVKGLKGRISHVNKGTDTPFPTIMTICFTSANLVGYPPKLQEKIYHCSTDGIIQTWTAAHNYWTFSAIRKFYSAQTQLESNKMWNTFRVALVVYVKTMYMGIYMVYIVYSACVSVFA